MKDEQNPEFMAFLAQRAALTAGADIQAVREAGESELQESADTITNNMLRKAYEFGYAKGWTDRDTAPEPETRVVTLHPGEDGVFES